MDALQKLIHDYRDETGESYEEIARRGGMSSRTVQALAKRERSGRHLPRPDTLTKLAHGLRMSEAAVRAAAGYGGAEDVKVLEVDRDELRMLVAVSAELDEERLETLLRRGRMLLDEQREERERRGRK